MIPLSIDFALLKSTRVPAAVGTAADWEALASFVYTAEKVQGVVEVSLDLTTPKRIHGLNRHFRGVDRSTDVISFRQEWPHGRHAGFIGDIAINIEQAAVQAKKMKHSWKREVRLLWIHGLLHLLGYTDYEPIPRRKMFKRQNELLRRWEARH